MSKGFDAVADAMGAPGPCPCWTNRATSESESEAPHHHHGPFYPFTVGWMFFCILPPSTLSLILKLHHFLHSSNVSEPNTEDWGFGIKSSGLKPDLSL